MREILQQISTIWVSKFKQKIKPGISSPSWYNQPQSKLSLKEQLKEVNQVKRNVTSRYVFNIDSQFLPRERDLWHKVCPGLDSPKVDLPEKYPLHLCTVLQPR